LAGASVACRRSSRCHAWRPRAKKTMTPHAQMSKTEVVTCRNRFAALENSGDATALEPRFAKSCVALSTRRDTRSATRPVGLRLAESASFESRPIGVLADVSVPFVANAVPLRSDESSGSLNKLTRESVKKVVMHGAESAQTRAPKSTACRVAACRFQRAETNTATEVMTATAHAERTNAERT